MVMMQRAPSAMQGFTWKVVLMRQHLEIVTQLVDAFGNENFASTYPKQHVDYAAKIHDMGWVPVDGPMPTDPTRDVPRNLLNAPSGTGVKVGHASADLAESVHPYVGLLVSMHHTGLQEKRYGKGGGTPPQLLELVKERQERTGVESQAAGDQAENDEMKRIEVERQERIKAELRKDEATAPWVADDLLWTNYKHLQFFDTFALYFCLGSEEERGDLDFPGVPTATGKDTTVRVARVEEGVYEVSPFPFKSSPTVVTLCGTLVGPDKAAATTDASIAKGLPHVETITLVKAEGDDACGEPTAKRAKY